jgi:hypothetical protein
MKFLRLRGRGNLTMSSAPHAPRRPADAARESDLPRDGTARMR